MTARAASAAPDAGSAGSAGTAEGESSGVGSAGATGPGRRRGVGCETGAGVATSSWGSGAGADEAGRAVEARIGPGAATGGDQGEGDAAGLRPANCSAAPAMKMTAPRTISTFPTVDPGRLAGTSAHSTPRKKCGEALVDPSQSASGVTKCGGTDQRPGGGEYPRADTKYPPSETKMTARRYCHACLRS